MTLMNLADVSTTFGDTARATILFGWLRQYAGQCVVVGMGIGFAGAMSHR